MLVWARERFTIYVCGQHFELETDHKPLERIYSATSKPCAQIERWVLRLQSYDFKVVYCPGKTNIADVLSRVKAIVENSALSAREIEQASYDDEELSMVKGCVRSGNWSQCTAVDLHVKDELCVCRELLFSGTRIIIPKILRD